MNNEITTPKGGITVVLKEYITGRDGRTLREALIKAAKINQDGGVTGIDPAALNTSDDLKIKLAVVSVDNSEENVVGAILDMAKEDYDFVMEAVDELTDGLSKKKDE